MQDRGAAEQIVVQIVHRPRSSDRDEPKLVEHVPGPPNNLGTGRQRHSFPKDRDAAQDRHVAAHPETIDHIGELGGNWLLSAIQQT